MPQPLLVSPGKRVKLANFNASYHGRVDKAAALEKAARHAAAIEPLAERLYAEHRRALLVVLQGMDTSGKDGTIRHVLNGVNPLSCQVTAFKQPSSIELEHDFLWRVHRAIPAHGNIGIFNRSHYEDVLVVRVCNLAPRAEWETRYERINSFEKLLCEGGLTILKFFLHLSKAEQRKRLQARVDDPEKRWKFRLGDLDDRKLWGKYQTAYEDALTRCNTKDAPWHIVPADHKWYRDLVVSRVIHKTLREMNPRFPRPAESLKGVVVK